MSKVFLIKTGAILENNNLKQTILSKNPGEGRIGK